MMFFYFLCTYVRSVFPLVLIYRKFADWQTLYWGLKIKANEIRKLFDCGQKPFYGIVLLGAAKRIDGTMGNFTVSNQVTRNGKVGRCHLWTGHHSSVFERISLQQNISRYSEADTPRSVQASLFYERNLGGFLNMSVRNEIKAQIIRTGYTMQEVVDLLHDEYGWSDSVSNLSAKLQRESIRYKEVMELAEVLGYELVWQKGRDKV